MFDFSAFTQGERALFAALKRHRPLVREPLGPRARDGDQRSKRYLDQRQLRHAPPQIGGDAVGERIDVVTHMHGLQSFDVEWAHAIDVEVDGVQLHVLKLERIIASKRATGRSKDAAALPALEALAAIEETKT